MVENKKELSLKLTDRDSLVLNNMIHQLRKSESEVVSLALKNLAKEVFLIEEFHIRSDEDCEIYKFEDLMSFRSKEYGFLVFAEYSSECGGTIYYEVYIPYDYLKRVFGLASNYEYELMLEGVILKTDVGFDIESISNYLCTIRDIIEGEIIDLLVDKNLMKLNFEL